MHTSWRGLRLLDPFNKLPIIYIFGKQKIGRNRYGVVFSKYLANLIPGAHLIYHGAEPSAPNPGSKEEARLKFSLPEGGKIALASGFVTATKGWDLLNKMNVPEGWNIAINGSKNHYNVERRKTTFNRSDLINFMEDSLMRNNYHYLRR